MNGWPDADTGATGRDPARHTAAALLDQVRGLAEDLRRAHVPVPVSGVVDACSALTAVDLTSREQMRAALSCTLLTRPEDAAVFDILFEARFQAPSVSQQPAPTSPPLGAQVPASDPAALRQQIVTALANHDTDGLVQLAQEAGQLHGGLGTAGGSDRYRLQRVLRALDQGSLVSDALRLRRSGPRRDELTERLDRSDIAAAFDRFLAALAATTCQRHRGPEGQDDATGASVPLRVEDTDITTASVTELMRLRQAVHPLAHRLAARMAQRHRRPRGALDMRRTIRRSISSGGVPLNPSFRRRAPRKPDVWLLCDVSGSVAEFARFTIALLTALHDEVPKLRSFLFVDDIVEVTDLLVAREYEVDPFALLAGAGTPMGGRQSNWGTALTRFRDQHRASLTPRTTVLLTGDGRSHDHDPRADVIGELARHTRGIWLLNPEQPAEWATGDSGITAYRAAGAHVLEVRTLNQLATAVERILHPGT